MIVFFFVAMLAKIKNGLQTAKNYLDTAKDIADLVSTSLGHNKHHEHGDRDNKNDKLSKRLGNGNITSAFFRLLGLDTPRIAAIAINSAIFLTQMISSLFNIQQKTDKSKEKRSMDSDQFDPLKFLLNTRNEKIQHLLKQAKNPELPNQLMDNLKDPDTSCVRLLMCKASPIILAAQESMENKTTNRKFDITSWLPTKDEFEENGDTCEKNFSDCQVFPDM
ncbi:hypothetical protein HCN44_001711 [Aphidius gifuensis]|uniref:Uncharacterized protein n=1 Tax=Aphidius gifuensis TaxID=684658 RepID=A0A834XX19_APHGI|nr:hypothetical protein HCN44_001711 [Aphidius gifuensis]